MNPSAQPASALARRCVAMGLNVPPSAFPPGGVALAQLIPWWRLWLRDPYRDQLQSKGAAVFPAAASGVLCLKEDAPSHQAVFASLLPLLPAKDTAERWLEWVIAAGLQEGGLDPTPLLGVLEHLLQDRTEPERVAAWARVLEVCLQPKPRRRNPGDLLLVSLLDIVGRSGLRALAPHLLKQLGNKDPDLVLGVVVSLARLGVPDAELPAEALLNQSDPSVVQTLRWALAFLETGDVDILSGLFRTVEWRGRVFCLRLVEAVLGRPEAVGRFGQNWRFHIQELLSARLQQEGDPDVVRCLASTLGLVLRGAGEDQIQYLLDLAPTLNEPSRLESLLNALLVAELPASFAARVEDLRRHVADVAAGALGALDRVLVSLGEPSGTVRHWLKPEVVALVQAGILRLPASVRPWFDSPGQCPEAEVVGWLLNGESRRLTTSFCAAYLSANPGFLGVLERIWNDAAAEGKDSLLERVGALIAGATTDGGVGPVELRCCLGSAVGGPVPESQETVGTLLGLLTKQQGNVRQSAEDLLALTVHSLRPLVTAYLSLLKRPKHPFDDERQRLCRFGGSAPALNPLATLPQSLAPRFWTSSPGLLGAGRLLDAFALPDSTAANWIRRCLDWENPAVVRAGFSETDAATLNTAFLQASASPGGEMRQLSARLATGVGPRLLEGAHGDRVAQRVIYLAAHDPDQGVREAGRQAALELGLADRIPATSPLAPAPARKPPASAPSWCGEETTEDDTPIEELLANLDDQ